jgi:hypothetical protein
MIYRVNCPFKEIAHKRAKNRENCPGKMAALPRNIYAATPEEK